MLVRSSSVMPRTERRKKATRRSKKRRRRVTTPKALRKREALNQPQLEVIKSKRLKTKLKLNKKY